MSSMLYKVTNKLFFSPNLGQLTIHHTKLVQNYPGVQGSWGSQRTWRWPGWASASPENWRRKWNGGQPPPGLYLWAGLWVILTPTSPVWTVTRWNRKLSPEILEKSVRMQRVLSEVSVFYFWDIFPLGDLVVVCRALHPRKCDASISCGKTQRE